MSIRSMSPSSFVAENGPVDQTNVQIFIPQFNIQKCIQVNLDETVWAVKQNILVDLPNDLQEGFNYGLFLPPCNGRAGKFLLEDRPFRDYPFQDCVPYLEMKYKKRVYKSLTVNEKLLKQLHTKTSLRRFLEWVEKRESKKIDDLCSLGLDPNFHNSKGETPLTLAACVDNNRSVIMALVSGGAHLDFRNLEGQTPLHRAVFLSSHVNVKTLLDLGSSPNSKDPLSLTPLYYSMLRPNTNPNTAELMLRDYAEIGTVDPHGNQEIHQACKNGLVAHLEHLLYYGADINSQNINGNTPLHICAVNNQESCARVLLFRSADAHIVNNQGQTAYHVAVITGHVDIAELFKHHDPQKAVPYRSQPRYNSKRRLTWSRSCVGRRKSISLSQCDYGSIHRAPSCTVSENASPAMPRFNIHNSNGSRTISNEYRPSLMQAVKKALSETGSNYSSTLSQRRYSIEQGQQIRPNLSYTNSEVNVPRILVIPRGPNGFGFILRGAKKLNEAVNFEPTPETPALQYFEDVDVNGMATKAGLKPNDFLLEINGIDVRCFNHDQVVQLIHMCQDTITLKIITISSSQSINGSCYGTLRQVKRASLKPAMKTGGSSLSLASGRLYTSKFSKPSDTSSLIYTDNSVASSRNSEYLPAAYKDMRNKVATIKSRPQSRRISASELEHLMARQGSNGGDNVSMTASIDEQSLAGSLQNSKVYTSVSKMKREKLQHQQKPTKSTTDLDFEPDSFQLVAPLKSFNSNPNLMPSELELVKMRQDNGQQIYANGAVEYCSRVPPVVVPILQKKKVHRPKTPPPPPPPEILRRESESNFITTSRGKNLDRPRSTNSLTRPIKTNGSLSVYYNKAPLTPPPYDPAGTHTADSMTSRNGGMDHMTSWNGGMDHMNSRNGSMDHMNSRNGSMDHMTNRNGGSENTISRNGCSDTMTNRNGRSDTLVNRNSVSRNVDSDWDNDDVTRIQVLPANDDLLNGNSHRLCIQVKSRSMTPESMSFMSPTDPSRNRNNNFSCPSIVENVSNNNFATSDEKLQTNGAHKSPKTDVHTDYDFNTDLQNALTKRRMQINNNNNNNNNSRCQSAADGERQNKSAVVGSPPKFISEPDFTKKDSGYASSRNSLERNDFREESLQRNGFANESAHRDFFIPQRIPMIDDPEEENFSRTKESKTNNQQKHNSKRPVTVRLPSEQDSLSVSSTMSSLSACSSELVAVDRGLNQHQKLCQKPSDPPPDYDEADSGNADDSENEDKNSSIQLNYGSFKTKPLTTWTVNDVCRWLDSLYLSEYKRNFARSVVDGCKLMNCGRAQFAQLGVTRIAHRLAMESSLKVFNKPANHDDVPF